MRKGIFLANTVSFARYHVNKLGFLKIGLEYRTGLCKSTTLIKLQGGESEILGCCICIVTITKGSSETQAIGVYTHTQLGQSLVKRLRKEKRQEREEKGE